MRMASAADLRSYTALINRLNAALQRRSEAVLQWHAVPQGYIAEIPEGKLLLSRCREFATLTMIYESRVDNGEDAPRVVERGRRVISVGAPDRLQRIALDLAARGVPGAPAWSGEQLTWDWVGDDGSRRMQVPDGELWIACPEAGPSTLTFEGETGMELLTVGDGAELERQGVMWWRKRSERPLQVVVRGQIAKLRSLEVAGLLGYTPVTDNSFVALARAGDELALLYIEGCYTRLAARISWEDAIGGEPFDVDRLLQTVQRSAANHSPAANEWVQDGRPVEVPDARPEPGAMPTRDEGGVTSMQGDAAMVGAHRRLCEGHLRRLLGLRGRGARKARELVRLILERLDACRVDVAGTRQEVHRELEVLLERRLVGGDRNIRDALDLLVKHSPLFCREERTRCRVLFAQLHDPESELMRRLAAEEAAGSDGDVESGTGAALVGVDTPWERASEVSVGAEEVPAPADAVVDLAAATGEVANPDNPVVVVSRSPDHDGGLGIAVGPEGAAGSGTGARGPGIAPPSPHRPTGGPGGSRDVLLVSRVGIPRPAETSLRGFIRGAPWWDLRDPGLEPAGAPSRMMWERQAGRPPDEGDENDSS